MTTFTGDTLYFPIASVFELSPDIKILTEGDLT